MSNYIYQDMSHPKRVAALKKLCKSKNVISFTKTLTEQELNIERNAYTRDAMQQTQLEDELKQLVANYKGKINGIKKTNIERLEIIANEKRQVTGTVFNIPDNSSGRMLSYDEDGELVASRELLPNEKQDVLFLGENAETPNNEEAVAAQSVLDQFQEETPAEEQAVGYEPGVREDAPNEEDLEAQEEAINASEGDVKEIPLTGENDGQEDQEMAPKEEAPIKKKRTSRKKKIEEHTEEGTEPEDGPF